MNKNLPTLKELYGEVELKNDQNNLNIILNAEPLNSWVKEHPMFKKVKYIPIERVEWLLTRIFTRWWVEVKTVQIIANAVVVTVRLYYQDVLSDHVLWQDGIGAAPLQTDSGAGAIEFDKIKNDAVMKAAPSAESYAVKDAAEKIGKIFGKDLNRADKIMYDSLAGAVVTPEDKYGNMYEEVD
jgi:hypothetical protein